MNTQTNGTVAIELGKLVAELQRHTQHLLTKNDLLEQEIAELRQQVAAWKERHDSCAALLRLGDKGWQTPEEVEAIIRHGQWVDYQDIANVVAQVQDSAHG